METRQGNILLSLLAIQDFLNAHEDVLATAVNSKARVQLDAVISELTGHASAQEGSTINAQGATRKHGALRTVLMRDHMAPVARIAQLELPLVPELDALRMPRGRPTIGTLASIANGMGEAATLHSAVFIAAGLPTDFVAQLNTAAADMLDAVTSRTGSRGDRRQATQSLSVKLGKARKIVTVLDSFVRTALKDNAGLLAKWTLVKKVDPTSARGAVATATVSAPVAPAPAPAAAA